MSDDFFAKLGVGLEISKFIEAAGSHDATKVILQPSFRDAEMALALAEPTLKENGHRALAVMVFEERGARVARVKPALRGSGLRRFVDPGGPLVLLIPERTLPHVECDAALWHRIQSAGTGAAAPAQPPARPATKPGPSALNVTIRVAIFAALIVGYQMWRHHQDEEKKQELVAKAIASLPPELREPAPRKFPDVEGEPAAVAFAGIAYQRIGSMAPIEVPSPVLPDAARAAGVFGDVEIEAVVDAAGKILAARVVKGPK